MKAVNSQGLGSQRDKQLVCSLKEAQLHSVKDQLRSNSFTSRTSSKSCAGCTPILTEDSLLATLHFLRCLSSGQSVPVINQAFFNQCYSAVSHSTGNVAQQFDATKHPSLAASYSFYAQALPTNHAKPETPTFIKDVSIV